MVELPFDLRKEKRVRVSKRVGRQACVELLVGHEQCPPLRMCIALYAPGSAGRHARRHLDQTDAPGIVATSNVNTLARWWNHGVGDSVHHGELLKTLVGRDGHLLLCVCEVIGLVWIPLGSALSPRTWWLASCIISTMDTQ